MVRMRVSAGPSLDALKQVAVNDESWVDVSSEDFEGRISVQIKGFIDAEGEEPESRYFDSPDRKGKTWSIAVQGRFLKPISADELLFGNTFDRPIHLPWGSGAVLSFMSIVDPTLEHDLQGPKPWALSPFITSMPFLRHQTIAEGKGLPPTPTVEDIKDEKFTPVTATEVNSVSTRRSYFGNAAHRKSTTFGPTDVLEADFCHSFLQFPELYLALPGGVSFDLKKYWDGQPVRFVCCERAKDAHSAKVFWYVVIDIVEDLKAVRGEEVDDEGEEEEDEEEEEGEDEDDGGHQAPGGFPGSKDLSDDID